MSIYILFIYRKINKIYFTVNYIILGKLKLIKFIKCKILKQLQAYCQAESRRYMRVKAQELREKIHLFPSLII